jgi:hypothetical protein
VEGNDKLLLVKIKQESTCCILKCHVTVAGNKIVEVAKGIAQEQQTKVTGEISEK